MATKFGITQLNNETPNWAKRMFKITFIITTALTAWIAATNVFPSDTKYELSLLLKLFIDPVIYGVSEMFGVQLKGDNGSTN